MVEGKWMLPGFIAGDGERGAADTSGTRSPAIPTGGRCGRAGPGAGEAMEEQEQRDEAAEKRQESGAAAAAAARLPQGVAAGRLHGS